MNGAAIYIFQKKAIGRFLIIVPIQMAGNCAMEACAKIILKRILAIRLMVGHIMLTVPAWRNKR